MRSPGFEPGLLAWQAKITYNEEKFRKYIKDKGLRDRTIPNIIYSIRKFLRSNLTLEEFVMQYAHNVNSYNNALKAVRHYCRFMNIKEPNLKFKERNVERLIIAPQKSEVLKVLKSIDDLEVKIYLSLCATTALRPEKLRNLRWTELDIENRIVNINDNVKTKKYRPNPLHKDLVNPLLELGCNEDKVFNFTIRKVVLALKRANTKIRPSNLRDFFYNEALKCGMNPFIVEWLMDHDIGIKAHYLADNIKEEYAKFERAFRLKDMF